LSVDSVYSHLSWIDWIEDNFGQKVSFPVIEDSSLQIAKVYGMVDETSVNTSTVRSCVFIDPTQAVQAVIHYAMQVGRSVDELLRVQEALIATFDAEAATPANWLPGDKTIDTPLDRMLEQPTGWLKRILKAQAS